MGSWPKDVGILAMELVVPSHYVDQTELEEYDGVSAGKYTIGLGQEKMGFCTDREDTHSLCLTVVKKLIEKYNLNYADIGRLEVGTESRIDKSKSVKSVLMQLFEPHGVTDLEGIDATNACYGGTAALFNAISWVESSAWNGRYALVVAGDIAVYAKGPARPTGGAGAVAILVGPNAPLVLDRGTRATYVRHTYDFYKPNPTSSYPVVDGKLTIECYLSALDNCYQLYCKNAAKKLNTHVNLNHFDEIVFHTPYCKLVQKSVGRLALNDFVMAPKDRQLEKFPGLEKYSDIKLADTYFDRDIEKAFLAHSKQIFEQKTKPSLFIASQVGNMYTPSLYGGLISLLISKDASELAGHKIGLFSYGSGLAASMFSITVTKDSNEASPLHKLVTNLRQIKSLLQQRQKVTPEKFEACIEARERNSRTVPFEPSHPIDSLFPGTYYLTKIDEAYRTQYERIPVATNGHA